MKAMQTSTKENQSVIIILCEAFMYLTMGNISITLENIFGEDIEKATDWVESDKFYADMFRNGYLAKAEVNTPTEDEIALAKKGIRAAR